MESIQNLTNMPRYSDEVIELAKHTTALPVECKIELSFARGDIDLARLNIIKAVASRRTGRDLFSEICQLRNEQHKLAASLVEAYQSGIRNSLLIEG